MKHQTNDQILIHAVKKHYGQNIQKLARTSLGSAQCYIANTKNGDIFLKIYQEKHDLEQISKEIRICDHLRAKGMQVSEYVKNLNGDFISAEEFGLFTIQKFISGITYEKFQVPGPVLAHSAEILGNIHLHLADISGLNQDFTPEWIEEMADLDRHAKKIETLISLAETLPSHDEKDKILSDCKWKLQAMEDLPKRKDHFAGLTRKNSHGDYNTYQWICKGDIITAVIDFGSCSNLPVIWELIRSYTYGGKECKDGADIDVNLYCEYLRYYLKVNELNKDDLGRGFDFYYYSLAMSLFGYRQYIEDYQKGTYNKLIEFALWRTQISRYLSTHSQKLDEQVQKTLTNLR
ncbi:MAG: phosphotransferase [Lachnospiraceae bacterium]|nr:phosphotransferase [Lachnospiraceae bacterium]